MFSSVSFAFADDKNEFVELTPTIQATLDVVTNLDESLHGGIYYEGGQIHILPVENKELTPLKKTRGISEISIDNPVEYSFEELQEYALKVLDLADELDIYSTDINVRTNTMVVGAKDWTEEKKEAVREASGIDNIEFIIDGANFSNGNTEERTNESNNEKKSRSLTLYIGDQISCEKWNSTLGGCIYIGSQEGYLTSGHNNKVGQIFYLNGQKLGVTSKVTYGGNLDTAFIKIDSTSKYGMTNKVRLSSNLSRQGTTTSAGTPAVNGVTVIYGSGGGYRLAVITSTTYGYSINGVKFTNLIKFDTDGEDGDSGSAVLVPVSGDNYKLVGIWKGINGSGYGIATRWDKIASEWGASIYN